MWVFSNGVNNDNGIKDMVKIARPHLFVQNNREEDEKLWFVCCVSG
jgi:hypothetical protein